MKKFLIVVLSVFCCISAYAQTDALKMLDIQKKPEKYISTYENITETVSESKARRICRNNIFAAVAKQMDGDIPDNLVEKNIKELLVNIDGVSVLFLYVNKDDIKKAVAPQPAPSPAPVVSATASQGAFATASPSPRTDVTFRFADESFSDIDKSAMEANIAKLLCAINQAYISKSKTVDTKGINMTDDCRESLLMGWQHKPYYCTSTQNVKRCLHASENMTVRDIPVYSSNDDNHERNISIAFNKQGQIECVRFAADIASYEKIMRQGGKEITDNADANADAAHRTSILSFVENYRNYYVNMDIDNITKVFADDAIIITGSVMKTVKREKGDKNKVTMQTKVKYNQKSKEEYLKSLRDLFGRNKEINVLFDDIKVVQDYKNKNIYGVTLKQQWDSKSKAGGHYSDVGYVFLLWDFANPEQPQIHIRTWQPTEVIRHEDEVFSLNSFKY